MCDMVPEVGVCVWQDDEGEDTGCPSSDPQLHQPHQQQQQNGEGSGESVGTADQSPMASGAG